MCIVKPGVIVHLFIWILPSVKEKMLMNIYNHFQYFFSCRNTTYISNMSYHETHSLSQLTMNIIWSMRDTDPGSFCIQFTGKKGGIYDKVSLFSFLGKNIRMKIMITVSTSNVVICWKWSPSHCLSLPSLPPVKKRCVPGRNWTHITLSSWANNDLWQSPKSRPHSLTFLSADPVTSKLLSCGQRETMI